MGMAEAQRPPRNVPQRDSHHFPVLSLGAQGLWLVGPDVWGLAEHGSVTTQPQPLGVKPLGLLFASNSSRRKVVRRWASHLGQLTGHALAPCPAQSLQRANLLLT